MSDGGFLLALPTQSIAVRLLVGAIVAVLGARLLLRAPLRVPRVRVVAAIIPTAAILTIFVLSLGSYRFPSLMIPSGTEGSVVLPIRDTYAYLAPLALPALLAVWGAVAGIRVTRRVWRTWSTTRRTSATIAASEVPLIVRESLRRLASRMDIDAPPVGVIADCPGGATVVGIRRPVVVLDQELVASLDRQELEGVIAHELAHVRRRDNLMALLLGIVRDLTFFVPGGRWGLRQLLVERELAADQVAVETTSRPGALAAGLLKVLESATAGDACAALLPSGTLVRRVEHLVADQSTPSRWRVGGELLTLTATFALVVGVAAGVPRLLAGADPDGGVGVLVTAPPTGPGVGTMAASDAEARAFTTYRDSVVSEPARNVAVGPVLDDDPDDVRGSTLRACAEGSRTCDTPVAHHSLALRPRPQILQDPTLTAQWRARPVVSTGEVLRIYWLSSLR